MDFEIYINTTLAELEDSKGVLFPEKKKIKGLLNDFEEGFWRHETFHNYIWDNIAETALSKKEGDALAGKSHTELTQAAKNLRLTDKKDEIGKGSELAEIFLYGLMKDCYGALPVVPKIFYKQNSQDNAKGADSVHIVIDKENKDFSIWFGEAKFYKSISDGRLDSIVSSVANSLSSDKLKKENSLVTNLDDIKNILGDPCLESEIVESLSPRKSIDNLRHKINIPILVIHECELTSGAVSLTEDYKENLREFHEARMLSYFKKQDKKLKQMLGYEEITFHLALFPVPDKDKIVDRFVSGVDYFKSVEG